MVVSVAKATSSEYYTGQAGITQGPETYYLDAVAEGEPAGIWSGAGAERMGLDGEVTPEAMNAVYSDFINPVTGEAIGNPRRAYRSVEERLAEKIAAHPEALPEQVAAWRTQLERSSQSTTLGWDATFSVTKSVTVAHTAAHRAELAAMAVGDLDRAIEFRRLRTGIEEAIHTANAAMLEEAASIAVVRTGRHGGAGATGRWEAAPGLTVASFFQHTSRSIDPQLHTHNVILNRAFTADADPDEGAGAARALDGQDLLAQHHALGAVADRVLEEELTRLGFQIELRPDGMARELTIVPTDTTELFSARSRQLSPKVRQLAEEARERLGRDLTDLELWRLRQTATKSTRARKSSHAAETTEEMLARWEAETVAEVGRGLDSLADTMLDHLRERREAGLDRPENAQEYDAEQVIAEAVAALAEQRAAWRPADLQLEIARRLPSLGGLSPAETVQTLHELTEQALAGSLVRQVSGRSLADPAELSAVVATPVLTGDVAAALASDPFTAPSSRLYASTDTLVAEESLRRAAIERGGHTLNRERVQEWLAEHTPTIGDDQAAAVIGLSTTDARLAVLVGPAGTGKSFGMGAFARLWADLTQQQAIQATQAAQEAREQAAASGEELDLAEVEPVVPGRVMGLAVGERATRVLKDDGLEQAANVSAWLGIQDRLADGTAAWADQGWRLRASDVVLVDEASMVSTRDLTRIRALAEAAGARMVLTGDPRQLGSVEAGGVLGLLDGHTETYTLSEVRRFAEPWEGTASLRLRDGDQDVLDVYDRHGRLLTHESHEDAMKAAATAAVADRVDGRSVVVVAGTNAEAGEISTRIRAQLIDLGLVDAHDQVALGRDGATAGVGDLIVTRQNDYRVGVYNRGQYVVTAVGVDGSLTVTPVGQPPATDIDGDAGIEAALEPTRAVLPAEYVAEHVQLGYAATVHSAQGLTVDAAHLVTGGGIDAATTYVGMTRGRMRNTAHVSLTGAPQEDTRPGARAESGKEIRLKDDQHKPSARVLLEQALAYDATARAATVEAELDAARLSSMDLLAGRYEAVVRAACRERLDRHLDQLAADGVLDRDARVRLGGDQGSEHLARLLRAVEQTGRDPQHVLTEAVSAHSLSDAKSPAQVLSHRINPGRDLPMPASSDGVPTDIAPAAAEHLNLLQQRMQDRQIELAEQLAQQPPAWALEALGPVPTVQDADQVDADQQAQEQARAAWLTRVGVVAGHREAVGFDDPHRAIGTMPGLSATEKRASHAAAWQALGQPQEALDETAMSEGRLRVRIRAAQQEMGWAPAHAHDALRAAEKGAETHRQEAALARARADAAKQAGDLEAAELALAEAAEHDRNAQFHAAVVPTLSGLVDTRDEWSSGSQVTRHFGERALAEMQRRGLSYETPDDHAATGDDVTADDSAPDTNTAAPVDEAASEEEWLRFERQIREEDDAHRQITETDVLNEFEDELADIDTALPAGSVGQDPSVIGVQAPPQTGAEELAAQLFVEQGWGSTPAQALVPQGLSPQELDAAAAVTRLIGERLEERRSQNASYVSDADRDDTGLEGYEDGRRRRENAELAAAQDTPAATSHDALDMQ